MKDKVNDMSNYKSFEFLKKLSFERMGGTDKEKEAAMLIQEELKLLGIESVIEEFQIDQPNVIKAKFEVLEPTYKEYEVTGYGMTGSTSEEGIEAPLVYVGEGRDVDLACIKGTIVLCHRRMPITLYKKLLEYGALGFVVCSGSVYDNENNTDLEVNVMRPLFYDNGKIPGVTMRIKDAHELVLSKPTKVRLTLIEKENKAPSHNVVATIEGSENKAEVIAFTAHYDSVRFSTGAYDNGTGTTSILQAIAYFKEHQPKRTLKFIWCGSEERGLLGSKAYVEAHKDELDTYKLCINVDMTGVVLGYDIACCTSEMALVNYINYMSKECNFSIKASQGVYSSDSTPFADNGVPAVSFARLAPQGGAQIHSRKDVLTFLDSENYYESAKFMIEFAQRMDNAKFIPVSKEIPQNMKDEIDYYYFRKERPSK